MLELVTTSDGSKTIYNSEVGEHYHSKHGALQESRHVFLNTGLVHFLENTPTKQVSILEVGFGTGLNFLLTAEYCSSNSTSLNYTGIEAYPVSTEMIAKTGYDAFVSKEIWEGFLCLYPTALNKEFSAITECKLEIAHCKLLEFSTTQTYDVLYFDAFAAVHQPEMWTTEALAQVTQYLKPNGIFVTYAITGNLKRSMKSLGFSIEKAPGAPGKREMLRGRKL